MLDEDESRIMMNNESKEFVDFMGWFFPMGKNFFFSVVAINLVSMRIQPGEI